MAGPSVPGARRARFSARAERDYRHLTSAWQERVAAAIEDLAVDPLLGKKLKAELRGHRSYRIGAMRILYSFSADVLDVEAVEDRKDVYR